MIYKKGVKCEQSRKVSEKDILSAIQKIKIAKETDNSAQGLISRSTDFRKANAERFLNPT